MENLSAWLQRQGLERDESVFAANDVDFDVLRMLSEKELQDRVLSLGSKTAVTAQRVAIATHAALARSRRLCVSDFVLRRTFDGSIIWNFRAVENAMSTSGRVTVERDGRTYAATYTVEGDMVHVKTHTETRSVALSGKRPEEVARRELREIVEASRRH